MLIMFFARLRTTTLQGLRSSEIKSQVGRCFTVFHVWRSSGPLFHCDHYDHRYDFQFHLLHCYCADRSLTLETTALPDTPEDTRNAVSTVCIRRSAAIAAIEF